MPARILLADDNPTVRTALRRLLSGPNREIVEAEDGTDAVSKALEHRPDIAILDLAMPSMDGLSAAREISRHLPHVQLVMCTMHWSPQLNIEAQKSGIHTVVNKANGGVLVATVTELIDSLPSLNLPLPASPLVLPPDALPAPITEVADPSKDNPPAAESSIDPSAKPS